MIFGLWVTEIELYNSVSIISKQSLNNSLDSNCITPPTPFSHIWLSHEIEKGRYIGKEELNKWEMKVGEKLPHPKRVS